MRYLVKGATKTMLLLPWVTQKPQDDACGIRVDEFASVCAIVRKLRDFGGDGRRTRNRTPNLGHVLILDIAITWQALPIRV